MRAHALPSAIILRLFLGVAVANTAGGSPLQTHQKELYSKCIDDSECHSIPHSLCSVHNRCYCEPHHSPLNTTACGKLIGDPCVTTCDALNSICLWKNLCGCPEEMKHSSDYTFCYKKPEKYGDLCDSTSECEFLGSAGRCHDRFCTCFGNYSDAHQCTILSNEFVVSNSNNIHSTCIGESCNVLSSELNESTYAMVITKETGRDTTFKGISSGCCCKSLHALLIWLIFISIRS